MMRHALATILTTTLAASPAIAAPDRPTAPDSAAHHVARGTFDVTLTAETGAGNPVPLMAITKTFHGDLTGTSTGRMLAVRTAVDGSAGYVAMERVTARLSGHAGGFALQHSGTMDQGAQTLSIAVVPDSGTGGLAGITGTMTIRIEGRTHFYSFAYALPR